MDKKGGFKAGGGDVLCVRFHPEDRGKLYVACADGSVRIHNTVEPYEHVGTLKCTAADGSPEHATTFKFLDQRRHPGELVACYTSGTALVWHAPTAAVLGRYTGSGSLMAVDMSPDGKHLATAGDSLSIDIFPLAERGGDAAPAELGGFIRSEAALRMPESHSNRVQALRFHPKDPNVLFSAAWDRQVIEWDLTTRRPLQYFAGPYVCGEGLDVHPDGVQILTASYREDDTLELWKRGSSKRVGTLATSDSSKAYGCHFHPMDPRFACVVGVDRFELRLVDTDAGCSVGRLQTKCALYSGSFSGDGTLLAGGGVGGRVVIASIDPAKLMRLPDHVGEVEDAAEAALRLEMHRRSVDQMRKSFQAQHEALDLEPPKVVDDKDDDSD